MNNLFRSSLIHAAALAVVSLSAQENAAPAASETSAAMTAPDSAVSSQPLPPAVVSGSPQPASDPPRRPSPQPPANVPPSRPQALPPDDASAPQPASLTVPNADEAWLNLMGRPGGVAVINAEDYKRGRASNLKDALDYAPGVFVQPRFGAEESRISIRGSGIQRTFHGRGLKLMQDGVPLNLADGGFDMQAIEPLAAQYIEVFRGANALEYGSTTLGGAIHFVSRTGHTADPLQTRLEVGSFDSFRAQISSGIVSGDQDAYVSLTHSQTDGFRQHAAQSNQRFFGNLGIAISPELETRFYLTYAQTDSELPGDLTKAQMLAHPTQAARVPAFLRGFQPVARFDRVTSDWKRDFELFRLANKTVWDFGDEQVTIGGFWSRKHLDHPILFVIDQASDDFGISFRYDNAADLFDRENHFVFGIIPTYGVVADQRFHNVFGSRGNRFADNDQTSLNADLFAQNSHEVVPDVALVTGVQLSYAKRKNVDHFPVGPDNSDTQSWTGFSPKLGMVWDTGERSQIFANVSRSFEPPSFGELVDANNGGAGLIELDAQTATTWEIGSRGSRGDASWDVAYYNAFLNNELLQYQVQPGLNQTVNADQTIHQGIELGFQVGLYSGLWAQGVSPESEDRIVFRQNYLWNDFRFENDAVFGNNRLPGLPQHYYRAELLYEHPSGFYAGPNVEWVPKAYNVDSAETEFADPYSLLGFRAGFQNAKGLSMFVEARNLTNETYAATTSVTNVSPPTGGALFLPGDGRSFYAGFEWKW